jgi:hypothetical protein
MKIYIILIIVNYYQDKMAKLILLTLATLVLGRNECSLKASNIGRGMATREFAKWDKNCTTIETFYNDMLTRDPTEKCLRRGYWDKAQDLYEQYSVDCSLVKCDDVGKELGKIVGIAFCNGQTVNTTLSICNAREESICSDTVFDYVHDNCYDKIRMGEEPYSVYDSYLEYCNKV